MSGQLKAGPTCRLQAPVGARVASQRCPILRWSKCAVGPVSSSILKESVSRVRFPGDL
jgi:hypothetical protein